MSVPTHNLYDFIHQVLENRACMCYFSPWGSKDLKNIVDYEEYTKPNMIAKFDEHLVARKIYPGDISKTTLEVKKLQPWVICHDQEPLNFDLYNDDNINPDSVNWDSYKFHHAYKKYSTVKNRNLRWIRPITYTDKWVLLHSEKNGKNLKQYTDCDLFIPAFYWSHAIIARDWYRFAEYDKKLNDKNWQKDFLIYSRDTSGSRQYRKIFIDNIPADLNEVCQHGSVSQVCTSSDDSAVYNTLDHNFTRVSIVLETVFDDRIHLTEKTLRAIACGHPFLLFNGPGALQYLQSYGFKTFGDYLDESYDLEPDTEIRMKKIIKSMQDFAQEKNKDYITTQMHEIANYNKKHFFSDNFFTQVVKELAHNMHSAVDKVNLDTGFTIRDMQFQKAHSLDQIHKFKNDPSREHLLLLFRHLRKGGTLENYVPPDLD